MADNIDEENLKNPINNITPTKDTETITPNQDTEKKPGMTYYGGEKMRITLQKL